MAKIKPLSLEKYFLALSKDSIIYGLGNAILKILAILVAPILTRIFAPSDYGIISLISSVISFLSLFLIFGMDTAVFVSFHQYKKEKKKVISSGFWFLVYWDAFLVGLCILFSGQISHLVFKTPLATLFFSLAFATAFFTLLTNYAKTIFRIQFQAKTFAIISVVGGVFITGLSIVFVVLFKMGLFGYFLGGLVGTILKFLVALYLVRHNLSFHWSWRRANEMAIYGSMLVPAGLSYYVFDLSDRFFVNHYRTLTELGLYSMAVNLVGLIPFFSFALSRAWLPMVFKLYFDERRVFKHFVPRIFIYYLIFFMGLAIFISLFGLEILKALTVPKFYGAARAIGPLALAMVFSATVQITYIGIYISKKTKLIALSAGIAAVVNLIANFLLIPPFGMVGAGWATAISYFFLTVAYFWFSQKLIYLKIDWSKVIKILILGVVLIVLAPISWRFNFWTNFTIKILEFASFVVLLYFMGIIERYEINSSKKLFLKILTKIKFSRRENDDQSNIPTVQE